MVAWAGNTASRAPFIPAAALDPGSGLIDRTCPGKPIPDVIGLSTAATPPCRIRQIACLCESRKRGLEIVHNGNERAALFTLRTPAKGAS